MGHGGTNTLSVPIFSTPAGRSIVKYVSALAERLPTEPGGVLREVARSRILHMINLDGPFTILPSILEQLGRHWIGSR